MHPRGAARARSVQAAHALLDASKQMRCREVSPVDAANRPKPAHRGCTMRHTMTYHDEVNRHVGWICVDNAPRASSR